MSEKQETVHVVTRSTYLPNIDLRVVKPVKVFDDRKDARAYAKRMNARSAKHTYAVHSVKKG